MRKGLVVDEITLEGIYKGWEVMFALVKLAIGNPPLYVGICYRLHLATYLKHPWMACVWLSTKGGGY